MPMTFDDDLVAQHLDMFGLDLSGTTEQKRERLAVYIESDTLAAWEVRSGRPWTDMTPVEAQELLRKVPGVATNPGFLNRLMA